MRRCGVVVVGMVALSACSSPGASPASSPVTQEASTMASARAQQHRMEDMVLAMAGASRTAQPGSPADVTDPSDWVDKGFRRAHLLPVRNGSMVTVSAAEVKESVAFEAASSRDTPVRISMMLPRAKEQSVMEMTQGDATALGSVTVPVTLLPPGKTYSFVVRGMKPATVMTVAVYTK